MSVGTDLYPHMPILRSKRLPFGRRIRALADSSDFWASGGQSSPKCVIPCLGRRRTIEQNLTPLALSSAEKSVTVQTNKTRTHQEMR